MSIELKVPNVGESVQEVQIGQWLKHEGDSVDEDESVVELETDKATVDLSAPVSGVLSKIVKRQGESVSVGDVIAVFEEDGAGSKNETEDRPATRKTPKEPTRKTEDAPKATRKPAPQRTQREEPSESTEPEEPAAHAEPAEPADDEATPSKTPREALEPDDEIQAPQLPSPRRADELEEVVPMSLIRRRIAQRLVQAQHQAALLTTFNEIDMSAVIALRRAHGDRFRAMHDVKLGFMSFFVKAAIDALRRFPEVNAEIRDENSIVYRNYYHIGIAIGGGKGLVVPVLRHAEHMSFAEIERAIADFARRAEQNKLVPDELSGGTFTISNGGVYGSLLSTPIVNPPQSGVLGMHAIQDRPVVHEGQIVVRPMMYVALSYDHRLIDGRGAVLFLKRIKETIEEPARMLFEA